MKNTRGSRWIRRGAVGVAALGLALGAIPGQASADSGVISASNGQCEAQWLSGNDWFGIRDVDNGDSDYCYVDYSFNSDHSNRSRVSRQQDVNTNWGYYGITVTSSYIYFHVCKERQDDPDICSGWVTATT
ncbi:hypothetical protein [Kitasatospora cineracea]|uniref:Secreted protein n=1 Tax=Kitasatospora cineracea TaxID=88074 RepID=A0A3N4S2K8_9ACTN|nr:hypothetical protein [Kitasatospora cineracea]RPE37165.1 hypothetical protein EDD38_5565 [Kitasatospora cineracea]